MTATLERPIAAAPTTPRVRTVRPRTTGSAPSRSTILVLSALVFGGILLRFWALGASHLGYDESFTAIAGRLPFARMLAFLRANDSHPPLDYLLRAPLARIGASELWFRAPSALASSAALLAFALWMRSRGRVGVIATALFALNTFQVVHGRTARGYAELELLGLGIAILAERWLVAPRRRHAGLLVVLVTLGLLTHVSMFLLAFGLLLVAGRRTDRDAWRWRGAIALAFVAWAAAWGSSFVVQARGGHSSWIPRTSPAGLIRAIGNLLLLDTRLAALACLLLAAGGVALVRADRRLARVWLCLFLAPVTIGAVAGLAAPVVLDRTFTLMAWGPVVAAAFALDALPRRGRALRVALVTGLVAATLTTTVAAIHRPSGPNSQLQALVERAQPGDIVTVRPASKAPELQWTLGARRHRPTPTVALALRNTFSIRIGAGPPSGRVWLLDWQTRHHPPLASAAASCAPGWHRPGSSIRCLTGLSIEPAVP